MKKNKGFLSAVENRLLLKLYSYMHCCFSGKSSKAAPASLLQLRGACWGNRGIKPWW